ncbi:MAG: hypothetical protein IT373_24560 [Polyangiaceae bacterium]|nr:hypothetical protein [Polyangiaceae bacterium]
MSIRWLEAHGALLCILVLAAAEAGAVTFLALRRPRRRVLPLVAASFALAVVGSSAGCAEVVTTVALPWLHGGTRSSYAGQVATVDLEGVRLLGYAVLGVAVIAVAYSGLRRGRARDRAAAVRTAWSLGACAVVAATTVVGRALDEHAHRVVTCWPRVRSHQPPEVCSTPGPVPRSTPLHETGGAGAEIHGSRCRDSDTHDREGYCVSVGGGGLWCVGAEGSRFEATEIGEAKTLSPVLLSGYGCGRTGCGVTAAGLVECWGVDNYHWVGDAPPMLDALGAIARLEPLLDHWCAVTRGGEAACLGRDGVVPIGVPGVPVSRVYRRQHVWLLAVDGSVWRREPSAPEVPAMRVSGVSARKLVLRNDGACSIADDGAVACWTDDLAPAALAPMARARDLAFSSSHGCGVAPDGHVECWGANDWGQLGNGATAPSPTPVVVEQVERAVAVAVGDFTSCALTEDSVLYCWGRRARFD